ncbi:dipeptide/oligopeptide/nickel ABC transporter ATP-binding protein [Dictyobacter sp. S3.2.2.5]|uniref:Dipeptide/oligopeptide/nickel ABC transporter ATP-binding protein n=1 Tax=Dictyobacter halimunensis TaxID=3026934 RepID=A0ABQ6FN96_9CHLR|nr:dipeptide/oligopeptide/nickel ABC transporter ATP-binding protein [Dictyobacter sp. S3.2.2.5]
MANSTLQSVDKQPRIGSPLLEIEDLRVYYDTVSGISKAIDSVTLNVKRGEILGIAGESGCGKSTLTTALLRLTQRPGYIAGGSIRFYPSGQKPINLLELSGEQLRTIRWKHLSYLPQGSMNSLNPVLRIADQFADVMIEHSAISKREALQKVPQLLQQVGLDARVARMFPHELSGGMKQRVTIAMAIALDSDLVIADEPTTALDVHNQRIIIQMLGELRDRLGMTIILVTHDMAVHAELADRVAVMYAGSFVEVGDVRQIFKAPRHPYTQGLINSIPSVGGPRVRLAGIKGNTPSPRNWPSGCRFHTRCPQVMPRCSQEVPPLIALSNPDTAGLSEAQIEQQRQILVACHLYPQPEMEGVHGN